MGNNKTIDGVPRELLERVHSELTSGAVTIRTGADVRALLAKQPTCAKSQVADGAVTGWLLVSHPDSTEWAVEAGSKQHDRALRAHHLTIQPLYTQAEPPSRDYPQGESFYRNKDAD